MKRTITLLAVIAVVIAVMAVQAVAGPLDDGCDRVRVKGTTTGTLAPSPTGDPSLSTTAENPARWHTLGGGKSVEATVDVYVTGPDSTSHVFEVAGLGVIQTVDQITRLEEVRPGLFEFDATLVVDPDAPYDDHDFTGELSIKKGRIAVDAEGNATAAWRMKGYVCEPVE